MPKRRALTRSGPCAFCGNDRAYTQEHVIPQWVRKVLKTGPVTIIDRDTGERLQYDQTLTLVVNAAVCEPCNRGPLKRLGERVRPDVAEMMLGERVVLTSARARLLATWMTERAILIGLARHEARDDIDVRWVGTKAGPSLRWLHDKSADPIPPPGAQVFVGYLDARTDLPAWSVIGTWPESLEEPDGYICAVSLGCLLFIAFGQGFRESDHHTLDGRPLGRLELPSRLSGYLVPIWPDPDELVVWPPAYGFSNADLPEIANLLAVSSIRRPYPARMLRIATDR